MKKQSRGCLLKTDPFVFSGNTFGKALPTAIYLIRYLMLKILESSIGYINELFCLHALTCKVKALIEVYLEIEVAY